uniref:Ig-like domain-containing protein n=1 Tax=Bos indicus x Bos taurus TaxID=30522 RepID=A0A4W2D4H8_BOBOX
MACAHIWTLGILFTLSGLRAQSVTQPEAEVPVAEGDPVTVKCTYSVSGSPYLFWYVQHRNLGLQFLLKYISGDTLVKGNYGFEAEFNKSQTSFHLKKPSVVGSDSALYFCAVRDTVVGAAGRAEYKPLSTENHAPEVLVSLHKVAVWL